ncbi:hypothetical protein [Nonomuraea sp. NPDC050783]|uniref:hypothetical protein n=1 Tax=Nonomuraea sp. NPDC050783 TaxID=3154634 RepID=UPI00346622E8
MIRELRTPGEVRAACGDDDLVMWVAQGLRGGTRAWPLDGATASAAGSAVVACGRARASSATGAAT